MFRGVLLSVTLYDVAEPDTGVESVAIGAFDQTEPELVRGEGGWALAWGMLNQWPEEREHAPWPAALRAARATIQARLPTPRGARSRRGRPGRKEGAGPREL